MEEKDDIKELQKFLIFSVGSEFYGTSIIKVREIIRFDRITPVHDTQEYIKGVINLRGRIIPILDLRLKMGLSEKVYSDKTVLVILDIVGEHSVYNMGIAVDAVHEVIPVSLKEIEETPRVGLKLKKNYLQGIIQADDRMVMILDIDKIISTDEIISIKESSGT